MEKQKKLGRGLGALLGESTNLSTQLKEQIASSLKDIEITQIKPNPNQPRTVFDEEKLKELAQSIKSVGLIEPIIVSKEANGYQIIAGERRFRAAQMAGFSKIPAIVKNDTKENLLEIMLIENIQREDLNPIEEAICYDQILRNKKLKHEELAQSIGKSRTYITNHLRLLSLPKEVKQTILDGTISMGHAKILVALPDEEQIELIGEIINSNMTVRDLERRLKYGKEKEFKTTSLETFSVASKKEASHSPTKDPFLMDAENTLREFFQTKVKIQQSKEGEGKIEIIFLNNEDIEKILEKLK